MTEVLSQTYGRPGTPGNVEVAYLHGLRGGDKLTVKVGFPGKGGAGGPPAEPSSDGDPQFIDRGGAGGGRENIPIIDAFTAYAESYKDTEKEPLCFLESGEHEIEWPYNTSTGTLVQINPGVEAEAALVILCRVKMVRTDYRERLSSSRRTFQRNDHLIEYKGESI